MSTNLIMHTQWKSRPADERFATLADMHAALYQEAIDCSKAVIDTDHLTIGFTGDGGPDQAITLATHASTRPALMTNWSASQLGSIAGAPMSYLRQLPASYAARDLQYSLLTKARDSHQLYYRKPTDENPAIVRAITSPGYTRIISANIVRRLMELCDQHPAWKAPTVYPSGDFGGAKTPCVGFAGDRDAYICLIDEEHRITDPTDPSGEGLARGIMVLNSDVGAHKLDLILFLCRYICGNFMIWGYKQIQSISLRHFGDKIRREWASGIGNAFVDYATLSAREEEDKIRNATIRELGPKKEDVIDLLFSRFDIPKKTATDAYEIAEQTERNPRSAWGIVQGLTRISQMRPNMDDRVALDRAAAKVLDF